MSKPRTKRKPHGLRSCTNAQLKEIKEGSDSRSARAGYTYNQLRAEGIVDCEREYKEVRDLGPLSTNSGVPGFCGVDILWLTVS